MEKAFDIALILHAEHELNASTFAARVTAATLSDIYSAVTSGIGALRGPLHGGANEEVIKLLLEAGSADKALDMVKNKLANKVKIPGFGHRVYHTTDPRAASLKGLSGSLGKSTGHEDLFLTSQLIEQHMKEAKNLNANVDFYSASTYYSLGIPIDLFTPIFAVSRMSGWTAHILEQYHNNRLIRPRVRTTRALPVASRTRWTLGRAFSGVDAELLDAGAPFAGAAYFGVTCCSASRILPHTIVMYELSFFRNNLDRSLARLAVHRGFEETGRRGLPEADELSGGLRCRNLSG